jgi:hypothetical protein
MGVAALSAAGSGLATAQHLLPAWGLTTSAMTQRHAGRRPIDLLITDDVDPPVRTAPGMKTPILLVTAYGSFMPSEQAALARCNNWPAHWRATPCTRLRRTLARPRPEHPLPTPAITQQRRARILLVEDNPVNQLVAKGMLAKLGCQVQLAAQGAEALDPGA